MEEILIEIKVTKKIHTSCGNQVLNIDLKISNHEIVALFGQSGVGKTTLLRMVAGLTMPDSGFIKVGNEIWYDSSKNIHLKTQKRNIGFVFQDYALFPNMTVKEHLLFANPDTDKKFVSELLDIFNLKGLCQRKPEKLSGGQRQRLAVARALARKPMILLLDEPLSALDYENRSILQNEILLAHKNFNATTLLVSHDINEVIVMANYVYIIENGTIIKKGLPQEIFNKPNFQIIGKIINFENNEAIVLIDNMLTKIPLDNIAKNALKINDEILIKDNIDNNNCTF